MRKDTIEGFRFSIQQKRLWTLQQGSEQYRARFVLRMEGNLDKGSLKKSLENLALKHEALRTAIGFLPGMSVPIQVIKDDAHISYREIDLSGNDEQQQQERMAALINEQAGLPFDLEDGPLSHWWLVTLSPSQFDLLVTLPSLCADAHSIKVLSEEISRIYGNVVRNEEASDEVLQYIQFSEWQNQILEDAETHEGRDFWRDLQIAQAAPLTLPLENKPDYSSDDAARSNAPQVVASEINSNLVGRINELAQELEVTAPAFILSCWMTQLNRLTGERDVIVNTLFDGRVFDDLQGLIGLTSKYIPIQARFAKNQRFADLLKSVNESLRDASAWQEFFNPEQGSQVFEENEISMRGGINFDYVDGFEALSVGGVNFSLLDWQVQTEPSKLRLSAVACSGSIALKLYYDPSICAPEIATRLMAQLNTVLNDATQNYQSQVAALDILGDEERRLLLTEWNNNKASVDTSICLHRLFEAQVERTPDAIALVFNDQQLTFRDLNARANQLARHLRRLGIGPDRMAALCVERSVDMIIGLMAILKAGGAYVPLDPGQARQRLINMLNDLDDSVLLAHAEFSKSLPEHKAKIVNLDSDRDAFALESESNLDTEVDPENLAYMIFTSGSTGKPKGAMIRHKAVANLIAILHEAIYSRADAALRVGINAPVFFDASVKQIIQVAQGHTLCLIPEEARPDGHEFLAYIRDHRVDAFDCTPSQLRGLMEAGMAQSLSPYPSMVMIGGEAIDDTLWDLLIANEKITCFNLYGPTECTVDTTVCVLGASAGGPVIGRPLANAQVHALDERGQITPIGVEGELHIGGAGLSRGYLGHPELTAERFIPNSFSQQPGARLYKSGDQGRYLPDGRIEFLGRVDHQVKVSGHRVELGEIEAALQQHPDVSQAIAMTHEFVPGDKRLVAYVTPNTPHLSINGSGPRLELPNGLSVFYRSRNETEYLYQEIFEDNVYLKYGISLPQNACVFDVGANIGLFTLFVMQRCQNARVYAFEPINPIFETLKGNTESLGHKVKLFQAGLADKQATDTFTYYPEYASRSGLSAYADPQNEVDVIRIFLENKHEAGASEMEGLLKEADDLFGHFFNSENYECQLRRLSDIIKEEGIERIDLLKIDVQRAELDVLMGIEPQDWSKIQQIVMEVHDGEGSQSEGRINKVLALLKAHGFEALVEQDNLLARTDRHNLYAINRHGASAPSQAAQADFMTGDFAIGEDASSSLPFYYSGGFDDNVYESHGIFIKPGDCIIDIGAGNGRFCAMISQRYQNLNLFAFEPGPAAFKKLQDNITLYGLNANLFNCEVSGKAELETFSRGLKISAEGEARATATAAMMTNADEQFRQSAAGPEAIFDSATPASSLTTLSQVISQHRIANVALLRMDLSRAGAGALEGIEQGDWENINQVVIESISDKQQMDLTAALLKAKGFKVAVSRTLHVQGDGGYCIFARQARDAFQSLSEKSLNKPSAQQASSMRPALAEGALKAFLKDRLPDYMTPSTIIVLDKLPLSRNGKVDRGALPAPEQALCDQKKQNAVLSNPIEEMLAVIWANIIGVAGITRESNFFDLGGHSLLATQLISRVRQTYRIELQLRALFESPTLKEFAGRIEKALLGGYGLQSPKIIPVSRDGQLPTSFAQQRLWFLDQLKPNSSLYNNAVAIRLSGPLFADVVERVITEITRRHEALRTTFPSIDGQPVQVIHPPQPVKVPVTDLTMMSEQLREQEWKKIAGEEGSRGFDLATGPMMRVKLIRMSEQDHVLVITMHHIVSDGWSMGVMIREVAALYEAYLAGKESPLEELEVQYADYAVWQRGWLEGEVLDRQMEYWSKQLEGAAGLIQLPTDRPRPAVQSYRGKSLSKVFDRQLQEELKEASRREGVTLFMTMMGVFQEMMGRYSGSEDVVVGTDVANRNRAEVEGLIGFFVNQLVIRTDLRGRPSYREVMRRVREVALGAYAHQDMPFEKLVEAINPNRSLQYSPIFQVKLLLQNAPMDEMRLPGLTLTGVAAEAEVARFEITMSVAESEEGMGVSVEYSTDLYDESTIERMVNHYRELLKGAVSQPERSIRDLEMLSADEKNQLLYEWNSATQTVAVSDGTIQEMFEQVVKSHGARSALVFDDQVCSYEHLNIRANHLANYLRGLGVRPESLVGLCMERSIEMIVGMLGILKAGAAYVPLDPDYPMERIGYILESANVAALVTQDSIMDRIPIYWGQVINIDGEWDLISRCDEENPSVEVGGNNLAYVIYTSGSTGQPKGVMVEHNGVRNLAEAQARKFGISTDSRVLQFASISFDASVSEIFVTLLSGATLCLAPKERLLPGADLLRLLDSERITTVTLPPSLLAVLPDQDLPSLLTLVTAGEACSPDVVAAWGAERKFLNAYGPTEATVCSTIGECRDTSRRPHIGRAMDNVQTYVLDSNLQPSPVGMPGELHIGGAGLSRGYINRPDLTAEKFTPNPFSSDPGCRMYGSGDLARYLPEGNLDFLGRADHQVKIRGFRIEPAEIESALAQHAHICDAIVLVRSMPDGEKQLVAYAVCDSNHNLTASDLRNHLKQKLPEFMIPSFIVLLGAMPLSLNGKIDKKALLEIAIEKPEVQKGYAAPRRATEEIVAGIMEGLIGLERIGLHDDFFEMGGHSLLATQVLSRIRDAFKVEIELATLFEAPTVAGLSQEIDNACSIERGLLASPISPAPGGKSLPLSFSQQRLWFFDQLSPRSPLYNIPAAVRLTGNLDLLSLELTMTEIIRRHEILRTVFATIDGQTVQVVRPAEAVRFLLHDVSGLPEEEREQEVRRLAQDESQAPFDLSEGPLVRTSLIKVEDQQHVVLLTMHHIVSDAWSIGILIDEVATLYDSFSKGLLPTIDELPIQYADYAAWQREWLQGEILESQLNYWREHLSGASMVLELPTDRPRPPVQTFKGAVRNFALPASLVSSMRQLARREGATLFMVLMAGFKAMLYRYTGQEDIIVGSPIAGRNRTEVERLIGFFINTLIMRTNVDGDLSFLQLLKQVRATALGAYAHQDLPFDKLVEELQPRRDLSRNPLFQVTLTLQNVPAKTLQLTDLTLETIGVEADLVKFDLGLSFTEIDGELFGSVAYLTDLFDASTIARIASSLEILLAASATDPTQKVSTLPLMTEQEKAQLLRASTGEQVEYPLHLRASSLFEAQAERTPEATAVIFQQEQINYRDLNSRANRLAHELIAKGARPDAVVGICLERSIETIISMIAVFKAGAAFAYLDPGLPKERLAFMIEDAQMELLITADNLKSLLPDHSAIVVRADSDATRLSALSDENPIVDASLRNLAYLIYTSGTTGKPKAVMVEQRNLTNVILTSRDKFGFGSQDVMPCMAPFSFDISLFELLTPLLTGGASLLLTSQDVLDPERLLTQLYNVTVFHAVPGLMRQILNCIKDQRRADENFDNIRMMFTGGDIVPNSLLKEMQEVFPRSEIRVLYGPTEGTIICSSYAVAKDHSATSHLIGTALNNMTLAVLDKRMNLAPVGVAGELHIGGNGVSRGYLNQADLTSEKYILIGERRFYKTGDLARYRPDGNLEFLGRLDQQIKIRGFRIEIEEIESVLSQHPAVREAVILVKEETPVDKRLVAYLVAEQEPAPTSTELRDFLKLKLPEYMIPSAFMMLEEMPLTEHGKVKRTALEALDSSRLAGGEPFVAPRNEIERLMTEAIAQVLNLERVGIHDNFFELGGHSLLATQVVSRIREAFGKDLPLRAFFESPTVADLALAFEKAEPEQAHNDMPKIRALSRAADDVDTLMEELDGFTEDEILSLLDEESLLDDALESEE